MTNGIRIEQRNAIDVSIEKEEGSKRMIDDDEKERSWWEKHEKSE